ncbi:hypothetical protein V2J09_011795 [Rumex salicifolius]
MRYLLKKFDFDMLALFETHATGTKAAMICQRVGLENSFRVDAQGRVWDMVIMEEGYWLGFHSELYVHAKVEIEGEVIHVIAVYGAPSPQRRRTLWEELKGVVSPLTNPVFIGGDFNTILRVDERTGGNGRLSTDSIEFGLWVNDLSLLDMGFQGDRYTWMRGLVNDLSFLLCPCTTTMAGGCSAPSTLLFFGSCPTTPKVVPKEKRKLVEKAVSI